MPFSIFHNALPTSREIHFWYLVPEDVSSSLFKAYDRLVSIEERAYLSQITNNKIRKQSLLARILLRTTLARYTNGCVSPESLSFQRNKFGKPEVLWPCEDKDGRNWQPPALCFNLSHTCSMVACGVTMNSLIGIDIEDKNRALRFDNLQLARRYFSLPEQAWLEGFHDLEERQQKFIQLWTLKEAYVKALGRGISGTPLKEFSILIRKASKLKDNLQRDDGVSSVVESIYMEPPRSLCPNNWQFILFQPTGSHYASICVEQNKMNAIGLKKLDEDFNPSNIIMNVWKTIPLVEDELISWERTAIASTTSFHFGTRS